MQWLSSIVAIGVVYGALCPKVFRVDGDSMSPTLGAGAFVVTVRPMKRFIHQGSVVTLHDPRDATRLLVKRVHTRLDDLLDLRGDNSDRSTDSRAFGLQRIDALTGVVVLPRIAGFSPR